MICQIAVVAQVIAQICGHLPGSEQIQVVAPVKSIMLPVDLYFVPVVVGVDIVHAALLRQLRDRIVHPDVITGRRRAAVEHDLDPPAAAVREHHLEYQLLPHVNGIDLLVRPVVILLSGIRLHRLVDQISLVILADSPALQPVLPDIVIFDKRDPVIDVLCQNDPAEIKYILLPEQVVRLPQDHFDRLLPECRPDIEIGFHRLLQVASDVIGRISVVLKELHGRERNVADTVSDIEDIDRPRLLRGDQRDPRVPVCHIALLRPGSAVKKYR